MSHVVRFEQGTIFAGLMDMRGTGILTASCTCGWEAQTRTNSQHLEHAANAHTDRYPQETV
jgi:hypothetical protein